MPRQRGPVGLSELPVRGWDAMNTPLPNRRLKLPGGYRSKGNAVLCASAHELTFNYTALGGRVARSLSAMR